VVDPALSVEASQGRLTGGICSTRIDFQLGTNAADTNGFNLRKEVCQQKKVFFRLVAAAKQSNAASRRSAAATGPCASQAYPQAWLQNAPKKCIDITTAKVLVHISCADCHAAVTLASNPVGACNENLSQ
jgi:hypothetical protein